MHCDKSEGNMIHTHHFLKQIGKTSLAVFYYFLMAVLVTPQVKRNTKQLRIQNRQHKLQQPFQSQKLHQNRLQSLHQHQFQLVTVQQSQLTVR